MRAIDRAVWLLGTGLLGAASLSAAIYGVHPALRLAPSPPEPAYVLLGAGRVVVASIDALGGPRYLPPRICGRYAVPGIWGAGEHSVFSGTIEDGSAAALSVEKIRPTWQALVGTNTWTGATIVGEGSALTLAPPSGSTNWQIGSAALMCLDDDLATGGSTAATIPTGAGLSYTDGSGVLYADGSLDLNGVEISVATAPKWYPITLVEAAGGLSGVAVAGSLPAGYQLTQDSHFIRLDLM